MDPGRHAAQPKTLDCQAMLSTTIETDETNTKTNDNGGRMSDWKSLLNGDPTDWLLEESNPSVRYYTLRWLLDLPEGDPDVVIVAQAITQSAPIRKLLVVAAL